MSYIWALIRNGLFLVISALIFLQVGCQKAKKRSLVVFTWADYLCPEVISAFEKQHDCRIDIDTFDSNESMYAKLKTGSKAGYDVIFPSSYMAEIMHKQGWLMPLKKELLPNRVHLNKDFLAIATDQDCAYSMPFMITLTGVGYLANRVDVGEKSWKIFADKGYRGRMTLLNDMREAIGASLIFEGFEPNTKDPKALLLAEKTLMKWRANLAKFENEQYKMGLASSEFLVSHAYLGDITKTCCDNSNVQFYLPQEGFIASCDDIAILRTSNKIELAHAFANHLLDPAMAAQNASFSKFLSPNLAALKHLDTQTTDLHRQYLAPEVLQRAHFIRDLDSDNEIYIALWDRVKSGTGTSDGTEN